MSTFVAVGDSGEYIARPRFIALREFGPNNIIYHNGGKYKIDQLVLQEIEKEYASNWKLNDKPWVLQFGFGTITKINYETGDVWVDNIIEPHLPIKASSLYPDESYT